MPAVIESLTQQRWRKFEKEIANKVQAQNIDDADDNLVRNIAKSLLDDVCAVTRGDVTYHPAGYKPELVDGAAGLLKHRIGIMRRHTTRDTITPE